MPECLCCAIAAETAPATRVLDTGRVLAFRDIDPQASTHVLVIPKEHHPDIAALAAGPRAGQAAPHVHAHVLGGRSLTWPPG